MAKTIYEILKDSKKEEAAKPEVRAASIYELLGKSAPAVTQTTEKKPGIVQSLAQGIAQPFLKTYLSAKQPVKGAANLLVGNREKAAEIGKTEDFGYFGKAAPIGFKQAEVGEVGRKMGTVEGIKDIVGTGLEAGSYLPVGAGAVKATGLGLKGLLGQAAKVGAREGAISGALSGAGRASQENKSLPGIGLQSLGEGAMGAGLGVLGGVTLGAGGLAAKGAKNTASDIFAQARRSKIGEKAGKAVDVGVSTFDEQVKQRVSRTIDKTAEKVSKKVAKTERLKAASPEVKNAIISKLDDGFIDFAEQSDEFTKKEALKALDIADKAGFGMKEQPSIVSGELATKQYDVLDQTRKQVGKEIGDAIKKIPADTRIDMRPAFTKLDEQLALAGMKIVSEDDGFKLVAPNLTPAERLKAQQLLDEALGGGFEVSPSEIQMKDRVFSKLQREAAMEKLGNLLIETPDGTKSLFRIFRDVFNEQLEEISPELKALNAQYAPLKTFIDDLDDTIFRTPNLNITSEMDPAEVAKVGLRRAFSEAQSASAYQSVIDKLDTLSRQLGYEGASPWDIHNFTLELRKLYPKTKPKAGFDGIISGIADGALRAVKFSSPDVEDQKKALRALLGGKKGLEGLKTIGKSRKTKGLKR